MSVAQWMRYYARPDDPLHQQTDRLLLIERLIKEGFPVALSHDGSIYAVQGCFDMITDKWGCRVYYWSSVLGMSSEHIEYLARGHGL